VVMNGIARNSERNRFWLDTMTEQTPASEVAGTVGTSSECTSTPSMYMLVTVDPARRESATAWPSFQGTVDSQSSVQVPLTTFHRA
jgi:hypothetical protein